MVGYNNTPTSYRKRQYERVYTRTRDIVECSRMAFVRYLLHRGQSTCFEVATLSGITVCHLLLYFRQGSSFSMCLWGTVQLHWGKSQWPYFLEQTIPVPSPRQMFLSPKCWATNLSVGYMWVIFSVFQWMEESFTSRSWIFFFKVYLQCYAFFIWAFIYLWMTIAEHTTT